MTPEARHLFDACGKVLHAMHAARRRALPLLISAALLLWIAGVSPAVSATRRVVLLFDERISLPGLSALHDSLTRELTPDTPDTIEIYREEMDLSRFGLEANPSLLRDYLRAKYASKQVDVVVAAMPPALNFVLAHADAVFPGAAIVFCGVDAKDSGSRPLPSHVTGVYLKREFAPTLELALRLHPDTRHVAVVSGRSDFDLQTLNEARDEFRAFSDRLSFTYLNDRPLGEILAEVSRLPPRTIVLYTTFFLDAAGEPFVPHQVAERLSTASNAPVYGFLDQFLDRGIVGGHMYSMTAQGEAAAKLALRILAGSPPSRLPPMTLGAGQTMFNWQQLQRWGINESSLPSGAVVRFRPQSMWEQYRWQMTAITAAIVLQALMISGLLIERSRRRAAERESHDRLREVIHLNRTATAGALSASIAHELNQPLGAILLNTESAELLLASGRPDLALIKDILADIRRDDQRASDVIRHLRGLLRKRDIELQEFDVNDAIRNALDVVEPEAAKRGVELRTEHLNAAVQVRADSIHLQQVILNLATNAMDAMQACDSGKRVLAVVSTLRGDSEVEISVLDSGSGIPGGDLERIFDPFHTTKSHGTGLGLSIARTIIENCGGRIWAENRCDAAGAAFRFTVPLSRAVAARQ